MLTAFKLVMCATQIMLLFDPEHITAANARKRHLQNLAETSSGFSGSNSTNLLDDYIRKELWLLDSLQSSPLRKHTKSSLLWYHRRWLLDEFLEWVLDVQRNDVLGSKRMSVLVSSTPLPSGSASSGPASGNPLLDATDVLWRSFVEPELRMICKAGERHPSNYAAWEFARHLLDTVSDYALIRGGDTAMSFAPASPSSVGSMGSYGAKDEVDPGRILASAIPVVQQWCLSHVSDTSGWAFLLDCVGRAAAYGDQEAISGVFVEVGNLAITLRVRQEPVWLFVRTILASNEYLPAHFRAAFVGELFGWLEQEMGANAAASEAIEEDPPLDGNVDASARTGVGVGEQQTKFFDVVFRHLKWVRDHWEGELRPAVFEQPSTAAAPETANNMNAQYSYQPQHEPQSVDQHQHQPRMPDRQRPIQIPGAPPPPTVPQRGIPLSEQDPGFSPAVLPQPPTLLPHQPMDGVHSDQMLHYNDQTGHGNAHAHDTLAQQRRPSALETNAPSLPPIASVAQSEAQLEADARASWRHF